MLSASEHSFNQMNISNLLSQHGKWHLGLKVVLGSRGWVSLPLNQSTLSNDEQEWQHQLRSSLHPALFAVIYAIVDGPMKFLGFFPQFRAMILSVLPNVVQAVFAAYGDFYTWKLAQKMYGIGSNAAFATVSEA
jgi:hypothetical protein